MSSTSLLVTRLALLRGTVDEMANVMTVIQANRKSLERAAWAIQNAQQDVINAAIPVEWVTTLADLRDAQRPGSPEANALANTVTKVATLQTALGKVGTDLTAAGEAVQALRARDALASLAWEDFAQRFQQHVSDNVEECTSAIRRLSRDLARKQSPNAVRDSWKSFNADIAGQVEDLFSEYVSLLGGVAIRERGVKLLSQKTGDLDDLCVMADQLIREELVKVASKPAGLAVPGRADLRAASWPMVRLGLSQWSIWGMPLEALQLGVMNATELDKDKDEDWIATRKRFGDEALRTLVGDVFASWALGPAYACALLYLRLDPNSRSSPDEPDAWSFDKAPFDTDRAELVWTCLHDQVATDTEDAEHAALGLNYFEFLKPVFADWRDAVEVTGGRPPDPARSETLGDLATDIRERLELKYGYRLVDWQLSQTTWGALNGQGEVDPTLEIRHLINTAWYALLGTGVAGAANQSDRIERLTMEHGRVVASPLRSVGAGGGGAKPPSSPSSLSPAQDALDRGQDAGVSPTLGAGRPRGG